MLFPLGYALLDDVDTGHTP